MAAYIVATRLRTRNPAELELYRDQARDLLADPEIKWLARFGACEVKEGPNVEGVAIWNFRLWNKHRPGTRIRIIKVPFDIDL